MLGSLSDSVFPLGIIANTLSLIWRRRLRAVEQNQLTNVSDDVSCSTSPRVNRKALVTYAPLSTCISYCCSGY